MFNTAVGAFSLQQKEFMKHNYSIDSNGSRKSPENSIIHLFIYSVMHDSDTNIPKIICDFHSKRFKTHLDSPKLEISRFRI